MDLKNTKILIAEDDVLLQDIWQQKIGKAGFNVITAKNGEETLEKIEAEKPDFLLLDIVMPKVDGFEVLKKVRSHPDKKIREMVVMVLSNLGSEDDIKKAEDLGSNSYIVKAMFSTEDVINKIKEYQKKLKINNNQ
jgi:DNA-binding response OmpR family regulator